ncbi:type I methionyl aminopeptidase [Tetragenococcus koreensis]|uniref:type I methionyl aminopeptidase n=1 Tax=Tetragenococcus koreensis TaxID=290335 RepID=UPI001F2896A5|nr:type I methionyl aminopeptidase [Tetragenococcus koreensis]MDN6729696.1 type I methionyl aminopeptidase [Alkalibacterium sp.]MCF1585437.1 type I methionyl aminopeptidase [Tetragenococcus koreensis]MCF1614983.1 type I methionyl aminopeptidase [Tetragenococcus koreensis]MCF1620115.1 type I methionyl aminopeptidase [Tetragenococcus koreensis]MCF1624811.1 type I methionyl aminopeptidase [Tetragenococcus koreensis]
MITLKSKREIALMAKSGSLLAEVHQNLRNFIKSGITTWDIEVFVRNYIESHGGVAAQIGFEGYEYATCISVNDEICHGFPKQQVLKNGDLVKVDMCVELNGEMSDSCWAYVVGEATPKVLNLINVTKKALYIGIEQAQVGNRTGDIGHAIQTYVESEGYSVVRDFIAHGIGPTIHEDPLFAHYGEAGKGIRLKEGMTITIEPMVNIGTWQMEMEPNGWEAKTKDGSLSCQYEHSLAITKEGPVILTSQGEEGTY